MAYVIPTSPLLKKVLNQLADITTPTNLKDSISQDNKKRDLLK